MTVNFLVHAQSGRILRSGYCQEIDVPHQAGPNETAFETDGIVCDLTEYVFNGEVVPRPPLALVVEQDPFRVTNIPEGTVVTFPGGTVTVDDGFLEWSATEPGEYEFHFANFPYQEETVIAHITDV